MSNDVKKEMSFATTVVALVNGMIGGSILVLPLIALKAGWLETIFVILITGGFSYYSCYLSILHLGDQKDLDYALLRHFNGSKVLKIFYDFCVWSSILLLLTLYFQLIVIQWEGLIPPYKPTYVNPCVNAAVIMIWCLCLKFFQFGAHIMGYGIASIVGYLIFLIWVEASAPPPSRGNTFPMVGHGLAGFAAMMGNAFSIQGFFIPVMKRYRNQKRHHFLLFLSYLIGGVIYYYIAFMGGFGILNRQNYKNSQTIQGFFTDDQWQVKVLEAIYLVHLYSVFPQYLLISKKRFFSMVGLTESPRKKINIPEIIYIAAAIGISFLLTIFNLNIDVIIDINGAVMGFCFVYFLPSILHIKCLYFPKGKRLLKLEQNYINQMDKSVQQQKRRTDNLNEQIEMENRVERKQATISNNEQMGQNTNRKQEGLQVRVIDGQLVTNQNKQMSNQLIQIDYSYFYCKYAKPSLKRQIIDMTLVTIMFLIGAFIMVNGLIQVAAIIRGQQ